MGLINIIRPLSTDYEQAPSINFSNFKNQNILGNAEKQTQGS